MYNKQVTQPASDQSHGAIIMFEQTILTPNPAVRARIVAVLEAALAAVDPAAAVRNALTVSGHLLTIDGQEYDLRAYRRCVVIGAGKAGAPMVQAIETALGDKIEGGLVVVKDEHSRPTQRVRLVEASHPMPNQAGVDAGHQILALAHEATADDLVVALLSGGGSALLVAPAPGISLADLQEMTGTLLACGATINEINCLRKHCSAVKGGQLARAAAPATLITLVLSDVVGTPLDVIASGPTVADSSTWADAWNVVTRYGIEQALPPAIRTRLHDGMAGTIADTPKPADPLFANSRTVVIGDNRTAALAAQAKAQELGYNAMLLSTFVQGEAAQVAKMAVALAQEVRASSHPVAAPACLILGGETTVNLAVEGGQPGQGGRNQELALAAALELDAQVEATIVSLATDGTDGPTDSAGGVADAGTVARGRDAGLSAADHLARHDAYPFLRTTNDLLLSGPTHTNVNDLMFIFVE